MVVFKYIEDKDVFQKFYSKMLAKRLVQVSWEVRTALMCILDYWNYSKMLAKRLVQVGLEQP